MAKCPVYLGRTLKKLDFYWVAGGGGGVGCVGGEYKQTNKQTKNKQTKTTKERLKKNERYLRPHVEFS